jgi:hypothetical protein
MPTDRPPPELRVRELVTRVQELEADAESEGVTETYDAVVRKMSAKVREGDWRSAAKMMHTLHRVLKGCSLSQARILARAFGDHYYTLRQHVSAQVSSATRRSRRVEEWRWVQAYLEYLNSLGEVLGSEAVTRRGGSAEGVRDLLRLCSSLFHAASMVVQRGEDDCGLVRSLKPQCASLISDDVSRFLSDIRSLEIGVVDDHERGCNSSADCVVEEIAESGDAYVSQSTEQLAAQARAGLRDTVVGCAQCLCTPLKAPLPPRWLLEL